MQVDNDENREQSKEPADEVAGTGGDISMEPQVVLPSEPVPEAVHHDPIVRQMYGQYLFVKKQFIARQLDPKEVMKMIEKFSKEKLDRWVRNNLPQATIMVERQATVEEKKKCIEMAIAMNN